jgi:hypothetical protein
MGDGFPLLGVAFQGGEIAIGKEHIQAFHARAIGKETVRNALLDGAGDFVVEGGEVAQTAVVLFGPRDDPVQGEQDAVDGFGL